MSKHVVVIGGGVAGLEAAGWLAKAGFDVSLVEKEETTGGHINNWFKLFPDRRVSGEVKKYLDGISINDRVKLLTGTTLTEFSRNSDHFRLITNHGKELKADAVIVATGFDLFNSARKEEYGYGIYDNVISSADLEKMFRNGLITMADGNVPKKIGMVHCVGSRDEKVGNLFCSKLCCVTAVKQAIEIKENIPESKVFCFYMDMRMGGAHYEELYREAQEKWGVSFIRGKVSEAGETINHRIVVKVEDTLAGRPLKMELDLLVLMAGMEMSKDGRRVAELAGLRTGDNRYFAPEDHHFGANVSNIEGVFYAGTCTAPMNITETISHSRAAVAEVTEYLKSGLD
ncbi:MAG: pyridine nucleotide-disulfide oxidoreductase [Bacteroidetes bacterium GWE2_41_25]|nr:MAG: pyridine nucleotide-disulfide oxidoreductase [Bacteroidetes bacterium GWA2_40_15]OFX84037.1 MAG: pyridine nucleotide-disulfide oxidoreductase [Bacteroidetes bacterium GWC2_40_22]OFX99285.1 MAG: pyridine nucleotide-disulfide oxidoreductase [Bacteroidetes bacterium GWE2_41_25]OFY59036.1 MAG: pyridine nucleotide-disulfide oxidoreductase [Bacteroidetes bacterium GWF2_41_9]HAM11224.1 FAD-dependent oxidoreductase [Bacteroidales bacterium]